jgi:small nuclear ribonucleoprotein (snRNP)-like protein
MQPQARDSQFQSRRIRARACTVAAVAVAALLTVPCVAWAQGTADFSDVQAKLRAGDPVVVTMRDGTTVKGRVVRILDAELVVLADDVQREIAGDQIQRIQRRRNGVTLGTLIGAGAAVPFALALGQLASNEGADGMLWPALTIVGGAGAGAGVDALLVVPRTVFDRTRETETRVYVIVNSRGLMAGLRVAF